MMKKKILPVFVSAVMVMTTVLVNGGTAEAATDKFTDTGGHWGEAIINEAAGLGIVGGYPEGYFLPDNLMKREEFYKLISNVLTTVPDTANTVISFKDVDPIEWYVPTIKTAVEAGITSGYQDGTFGIGQMISRQEAAKVVASVIPASDLDTTKTAQSAKDAAEIGDWALPYVNLMFQKGYMQGDTEGNFRPTMALTRAEAATLLLNVKKKESVIAGPGKSTTATTTSPAVAIGDAGCQKVHSVSEGAFTFGTGTRNDPYQINTEAQLNHVREHATDGSCFILTSDIKIKSDFATVVPSKTTSETNWSEGNFVPIGTKDKPFDGIFDGDGHTISGFTISGVYGPKSDTAEYVGLFGNVDASGSVEDLTLESSSIKGGVYVGGIVGYNSGEVINCVLGSSSDVSGSTNVGGIVGYTTKTLKSNVNKGKVTGSGSNVGGIVGSASLEGDAVKGCANKGNVSGKARTGGIIGYLATSSMTVNIDGCSNTGEVSSLGDYAGGIVGYADGDAYSLYIKSCYNTGTLSGEGSNGGIAGYAKGSKTKIYDCYNTGQITGKASGGIAGSNEGSIERCYNKGKVVADSEAGGIVGYQNTGEGRLSKCYNDGAITANTNVGGLAGLSKDKIYSSYNIGKVKGSSFAGGLVGLNYASIQMSYNAGEVNCSNSGGALVGGNRAGLMNCFWLKNTSDKDIGTEYVSSSRKIVMQVSEEELSGQVKVKLDNGYQLITGYLNEKAGEQVWEFLYQAVQAASDSSTTVISDGGGVVKPIELASTDSTGNTIHPSDLNSVYLYPSLINVERK
ncbi:S-layer homology domain-containing protein [Clostridium aminobutyricum]|uniref:S-layer homology domain-containing protein n=1 Tax=Clostridium aminobutyricum TaxID=33953 RepID=A0A939DB72_CLOAM|nr:S-layer homology domain-containing protein [Clostridium aminobutyricum]MBN7774083.1 S-layer homology domain-containing protein [Clostridium aminobutyricum]